MQNEAARREEDEGENQNTMTLLFTRCAEINVCVKWSLAHIHLHVAHALVMSNTIQFLFLQSVIERMKEMNICFADKQVHTRTQHTQYQFKCVCALQ